MDQHMKQLQEKVTDYSRFSFILLALSTYLYIGLLLPTYTIHISKNTLITFMIILLCGALILHDIALKAKIELYQKQNMK